MREGVLSFVLAVISRLLLRRDRKNGAVERVLKAFPFEKERILIPSGDRRLSAVYVSADDDTPVVLICHGIGELVEYWAQVQWMLRWMGVSSLVFNYSGYGASSGRISAGRCEEDAIAAYRELVDRRHRSIFLLGFSLGSGVSCAAASRIDIDGLILCEGFSTFREGAKAIGFPHWLTHIVPDVWDTVVRVCDLNVPVLVVHSDADDLFPVSMPKRVADACGTRGKLIMIEGLSHNEPIFAPTAVYWQPIVDWVKQRSSEALVRESPARSQSALSG
jgi:alpha-beta hydrolase superfamily lysophospholipase